MEGRGGFGSDFSLDNYRPDNVLNAVYVGGIEVPPESVFNPEINVRFGTIVTGLGMIIIETAMDDYPGLRFQLQVKVSPERADAIILHQGSVEGIDQIPDDIAEGVVRDILFPFIEYGDLTEMALEKLIRRN